MKTPWITLTLLALLCFAWVEPASATTWGEREQACPLCDQSDTYHVPASWGSYIYRAPSRLQLVAISQVAPPGRARFAFRSSRRAS